ncbi:carbohydrate sulfotransferase 15-like [Amphiura filiformis]|uniref:carbohydrate sulfotransferase 15-like n=1 Tax=Amphiura filiformis TaxID=82378 RepID=UPI003B2265A2
MACFTGGKSLLQQATTLKCRQFSLGFLIATFLILGILSYSDNYLFSWYFPKHTQTLVQSYKLSKTQSMERRLTSKVISRLQSLNTDGTSNDQHKGFQPQERKYPQKKHKNWPRNATVNARRKNIRRNKGAKRLKKDKSSDRININVNASDFHLSHGGKQLYQKLHKIALPESRSGNMNKEVSMLSLNTKPHVADTKIWNQMVKYFPELIRRFSKDFLSEYKNPCFVENGRTRCLPYFYLGGAPKCGTTDLWFNLLRHPDVFSQPRFKKEPHFWKDSPKTSMKRYCLQYCLDTCNTGGGELVSKSQNYATAKVFSRPNNHVLLLIDYRQRAEHYLRHFNKFAECVSKDPVKREKLIAGDGSASTLWVNYDIVKKAGIQTKGEIPFVFADVIHAIQPKAKVIFILRDPTNRTISDYFAFSEKYLPIDIHGKVIDIKLSPEDFHAKVVDKIKLFKGCLRSRSLKTCANVWNTTRDFPRLHISVYIAHIQEWLRVFPKDQILILRTEDWHNHEEINLLQDVFKFLDIEALPESNLQPIRNKVALTDINNKQVTQKQSDKYGEIFPKTRKLLNEFYAPYNKQLAAFLNDKKFLWKT